MVILLILLYNRFTTSRVFLNIHRYCYIKFYCCK